MATQLSPDDDLTQLVSGVTMLVKDGQVYNDPTGTPPSGLNPETAIGINQDGTRVIAVSGYGQARDRERSREAGFDAHLTKPVDIARLRQLVSDIARFVE